MHARHTRLATVAVTTLLALGLSACGSSSGGSSAPSPTPPSIGSTPAAQQVRDVKAALNQYWAGLEQLQSSGRTAGLLKAATPAWTSTLQGNLAKLHAQGKTVLGRSKTISAEVTIKGATADAVVCSDATGVFVVKKGTKQVQPGTPSAGRTEQTITLQLDGGAWKVSKIPTTGARTC